MLNCNLVQGVSEADVSNLFHELDKDRNGTVSLTDFLGKCGLEDTLPKHKQFLATTLEKEHDIIAYKTSRKKAHKEG